MCFAFFSVCVLCRQAARRLPIHPAGLLVLAQGCGSGLGSPLEGSQWVEDVVERLEGAGAEVVGFVAIYIVRV